MPAHPQQIFRPTWLYVKRHSVTGLFYFGKTFGDPHKYNGSGAYWKNHLAKYGGGDLVETLWTRLFKDESKLKRYALRFSKRNNIVDARRPDGKKKWANLVFEDGVTGGYPAGSMSEHSLKKMSVAGKKKVPFHDPVTERMYRFYRNDPKPVELGLVYGRAPSVLRKIGISKTGTKLSMESRRKVSESKRAQNRRMTAEERIAHSIRNSGSKNGMYGKTHTEEVRARLSKATTRQLLEKNPMHDPKVAKKCGATRIGKKWYNDGKSMYQLFDGDPNIRKLKLVPGMLPNQVGWKKYNDGSKNYSCPPGDPRIKKLKLVPGLLKKGD